MVGVQVGGGVASDHGEGSSVGRHHNSASMVEERHRRAVHQQKSAAQSRSTVNAALGSHGWCVLTDFLRSINNQAPFLFFKGRYIPSYLYFFYS